MSDQQAQQLTPEDALNAKVMALCRAAATVRGGEWIMGAPTPRLLPAMLAALERDGWNLARTQVAENSETGERTPHGQSLPPIAAVPVREEGPDEAMVEALATLLCREAYVRHENREPPCRRCRSEARRYLTAAFAAARLPVQPDEELREALAAIRLLAASEARRGTPSASAFAREVARKAEAALT